VFHLKPLEELLEYQIPVVWPEDSWFEGDLAGPVPAERRAKRSPRSPGAKRARGRTRNSAPRRRHEPTLPPRPKDYFPGTFFGFKPKPQAKGQTDSPADKPGQKAPSEQDGKETPDKSKTAAPKRRRNYRRGRRPAARKKSAQGKAAPRKTSSGKTAPKRATSRKAASKKSGARKSAPRKTAPEKAD